MKVTITEHDGCFGIDMEPETDKEIVQLVRLSLNATKELRVLNTYVNRDGTASASIVLGKRRQPTNIVKS